jgi:hypothetical protein
VTTNKPPTVAPIMAGMLLLFLWLGPVVGTGAGLGGAGLGAHPLGPRHKFPE